MTSTNMCALAVALLAALASFGAHGADDCTAITDAAERLACYDKAATHSVPSTDPEEVETTTPATDAVEARKRAVDQMLAGDLLDPLSAQQYQVSGPLECDRATGSNAAANLDGDCVCYQVNSKNRLGGYTGQKLNVASLFPVRDLFLAVDLGPVRTPAAVRACFAAGLEDRDAAKIHALAK